MVKYWIEKVNQLILLVVAVLCKQFLYKWASQVYFKSLDSVKMFFFIIYSNSWKHFCQTCDPRLQQPDVQQQVALLTFVDIHVNQPSSMNGY